MRLLLIHLLLLFFIVPCLGQQIDPYTKEPVLENYYTENNMVKKHRIKYMIDSCEYNHPYKVNIKIYDTSGRLAGNINYPVDNFDNPYSYRYHEDTTFRLNYNKERTKLISFERFVHNSKGQIIHYMQCVNSYLREDSYYISYKDFYYDDQHRLKSQLSYSREDYPGQISDQIMIRPTDLTLNDVIYYSYQNLKNGSKLVIGKHGLGKPAWRKTDSTLYDRQNRIIRFSSYSDKRYKGELLMNNVIDITEYQYTDSSLLITEYFTYCHSPLSNTDCFQYAHSEKDVKLIIYNKEKLKKAVYDIRSNNEKHLTNKFEYVYYE